MRPRGLSSIRENVRAQAEPRLSHRRETHKPDPWLLETRLADPRSSDVPHWPGRESGGFFHCHSPHAGASRLEDRDFSSFLFSFVHFPLFALIFVVFLLFSCVFSSLVPFVPPPPPPSLPRSPPSFLLLSMCLLCSCLPAHVRAARAEGRAILQASGDRHCTPRGGRSQA